MQVTELLVHFNKLKIIFLLIFISFFHTYAQVYPDSSVHKILKSGIELIVNQKYDDAIKLFDRLDKTRKDLPLGKIYLAATEIAKSFDYQEPYNDELINRCLDGAKKTSEELLKSDEENIWYNYFFALTEGYLAYYNALKEDWLSTFKNAFSSVSAFEYCLNLDNNFYESLIAIGSYKFWRSKKTEWLLFAPDEKEIGIEELIKAVEQTGYNSYLASYSLMWIYIEQEAYTDAIRIAENSLANNPESRIFKWGLARAYESIDPAKAAKLYDEILNSYPIGLKSNKINEVVIKHLVAQQLVKIGEREAAIDLCNQILSIKGYIPFELDKLSERLERVRDLKNTLILK
jgi:hypothetical protein